MAQFSVRRPRVFLSEKGIPVLLFGLLLVLVCFLPIPFTFWDFRNNLWGPSHLLVTGKSPYAIKQLFPDTNAVWLPQIIGLLFPMGWLPFDFAARIGTAVSIAALGLLVYFGLPESSRSAWPPSFFWSSPFRRSSPT